MHSAYGRFGSNIFSNKIINFEGIESHVILEYLQSVAESGVLLCSGSKFELVYVFRSDGSYSLIPAINTVHSFVIELRFLLCCLRGVYMSREPGLFC